MQTENDLSPITCCSLFCSSYPATSFSLLPLITDDDILHIREALVFLCVECPTLRSAVLLSPICFLRPLFLEYTCQVWADPFDLTSKLSFSPAFVPLWFWVARPIKGLSASSRDCDPLHFNSKFANLDGPPSCPMFPFMSVLWFLSFQGQFLFPLFYLIPFSCPFLLLVKECPREQSSRFQNWSFWVSEVWSLHKNLVFSSGCVAFASAGSIWLWKTKGKMGVVIVFLWVCVFLLWMTTQFASRCWRISFANASIMVRCF